MRNSALVLSWLRLVQAARNGEEQNTEAFLKGGQLYVRTTRDVHQEEELLVWYDRELCHLLGFTETCRGSGEGEPIFWVVLIKCLQKYMTTECYEKNYVLPRYYFCKIVI